MEKEQNHINLQLFADGGADAGANPTDNAGKGIETEQADIELQSKIDKAVTKALSTQKSKLEATYNETLKGYQDKIKSYEDAGLTDAQKAAKQLEAAKVAEATYNEKIKRLEIGSSFQKMGIEETDYSPIVDDYIKNDFVGANTKLAAIIEKKANNIAAQKYNANNSNLPNPNGGNGDDKVITKAQFEKMTYSQQMEALEKNPELKKLV